MPNNITGSQKDDILGYIRAMIADALHSFGKIDYSHGRTSAAHSPIFVLQNRLDNMPVAFVY